MQTGMILLLTALAACGLTKVDRTPQARGFYNLADFEATTLACLPDEVVVHEQVPYEGPEGGILIRAVQACRGENGQIRWATKRVPCPIRTAPVDTGESDDDLRGPDLRACKWLPGPPCPEQDTGFDDECEGE